MQGISFQSSRFIFELFSTTSEVGSAFSNTSSWEIKSTNEGIKLQNEDMLNVTSKSLCTIVGAGLNLMFPILVL